MSQTLSSARSLTAHQNKPPRRQAELAQKTTFATGVVVELAALRARRLSLRAIARTLADRGMLARSGRPFAPSTLWPLVRNRAVTNRATAS